MAMKPMLTNPNSYDWLIGFDDMISYVQLTGYLKLVIHKNQEAVLLLRMRKKIRGRSESATT